MKKQYLLLLFWYLSTMSHALTFTVDKITYKTIDESTVKVTGYTSTFENFFIPSTVTYNNVKYDVKEIDSKGLEGGKNNVTSKMVSLIISEGITKIGNNAIQNNSKLEFVSLPSSLIEIGESAFGSLSSLKRIDFPNGSNLQVISNNAFKSCKSLELINFYSNDVNASQTITVFPECLTSIGDYAFSGSAFKAIVLNGELTKINKYSFNGCKNLEYIWIKEGVTTLLQYSFYNCPALRYIVLPSTLKSIGSGALVCPTKNGKSTRTVNITYIILGDTPFAYSSAAQTDFYGLSIPANFSGIEGDHFYVKESAVDSYKEAWKKCTFCDYIDYKIPMNSELSYFTNVREFDADYTVTSNSGNKPYVAYEYGDEYVSFKSIDDNIVPEGTAVVIKRTSNSDTWYQIAENQGKSFDGVNYLKGIIYSDVINPTTTTGQINLILYNGIFCRFDNAGLLGGHKAYLQLPNSSFEKLKIRIFEDNTTTGISNNIVLSKNKQNDVIYNLNGTKANSLQKGVYIINKKKIFIK